MGHPVDLQLSMINCSTFFFPLNRLRTHSRRYTTIVVVFICVYVFGLKGTITLEIVIHTLDFLKQAPSLKPEN